MKKKKTDFRGKIDEMRKSRFYMPKGDLSWLYTSDATVGIITSEEELLRQQIAGVSRSDE